MAGVYHANPYNSTYFTTCCRVAILSHQQKCPACKVDVYPFTESMTDKERAQSAGGYYNHNTKMARMHYANRYKK
jgi:hypothetical protein